jgi:hypothetical protein
MEYWKLEMGNWTLEIGNWKLNQWPFPTCAGCAAVSAYYTDKQ